MKLNFEKFLNENGLKVGDKVKFKNRYNDNDTVYKITMNFMTNFLYLENVNSGIHIGIQYLQRVEFEKLEQDLDKEIEE